MIIGGVGGRRQVVPLQVSWSNASFSIEKWKRYRKFENVIV